MKLIELNLQQIFALCRKSLRGASLPVNIGCQASGLPSCSHLREVVHLLPCFLFFLSDAVEGKGRKWCTCGTAGLSACE